jgi:hypothetical protein
MAADVRLVRERRIIELLFRYYYFETYNKNNNGVKPAKNVWMVVSLKIGHSKAIGINRIAIKHMLLQDCFDHFRRTAVIPSAIGVAEHNRALTADP